VTYCRAAYTGSNSLEQRMDTMQAFMTADSSDLEETTPYEQTWWTRLNYANAQQFALQQYDTGFSGESLKMALIAPIPRILWPDKPIIESGYDFYKKLTGADEMVSFGIGFFVEAYWNGGWIAVILCAIGIGWLYGWITLLITKEIAEGNYWVCPIALLWVKSGGRVDGWIHTEIAGPLGFTIIYLLLMRAFQRTGAVQRLKLLGLRNATGK
jgi:hypothetical protein